MKLPSSVYSAACDDINVLGFLYDIPFNQRQSTTQNNQNNKCEVRYDNLQTACTTESKFNINSYIGTSWVGTTQLSYSSLTLQQPISPTSYVNIVLRNLTSIDLYTGVTNNVTTALPLPVPSVSTIGGITTCQNVVVGITYYIYIDPNNGSITGNVQADVTIANQVIATTSTVGAVPVEYQVVWKDRGLQDTIDVTNPGTEVKFNTTTTISIATFNCLFPFNPI